MLRSPLEIARSFHQVSLKVFGETETDFSNAWFLQEARKEGYNLPISCVDKQLLIYGEIAKIGMQVERLLSIIPLDKIHFIFFDTPSRAPSRSTRCNHSIPKSSNNFA